MCVRTHCRLSQFRVYATGPNAHVTCVALAILLDVRVTGHGVHARYVTTGLRVWYASRTLVYVFSTQCLHFSKRKTPGR